MRVLLIKTSSLGDVLHTLPALTDAAEAIPGIRFDWVVEEAFAEIPEWHPAVDRVIRVAIRRWRKSPLKAVLSGEWLAFRRQLREQEYDLVLDAQGLIKSALLSRMSKGRVVGLDKNSAREPLASRFYQQGFSVERGEHAIIRLRKLFAKALDYELPASAPDYGINRVDPEEDEATPSILFVHGTTWATKHWPDQYWVELAGIVNSAGYKVLLPWGSAEERARAERIAADHDAEILPRGSLNLLSRRIQQAAGAICVDSGIAHLVAAQGIPSVTIYGATSAHLTGTMGNHQLHAEVQFDCAPCLSRECDFRGASDVRPDCYQSVPPNDVWQKLQSEVNRDG